MKKIRITLQMDQPGMKELIDILRSSDKHKALTKPLKRGRKKAR